MNRDMRDAHETARARDERSPKWADLFGIDPHYPEPERAEEPHATTQARDAAWMLGALDGTSGPRDRTHDDQESDTMTEPQTKTEWLADIAVESHRTNELLTEIRDRLPERVEARVAPFDPDVIAANLEAIKHEAETPTRGHGECCESRDITEEPCKRGCDRDDLGMAHSAGMTCCDTCGTERPLNSICPVCEPAPADVDSDEALVKVLVEAWHWGGSFGVLARAAREHIEAERPPETDWEGIYLSERRKREKAEADLAHVDHLTAENARLREWVAALVSVGYSHTPDCEADDWQRVAYGGHPDCGLCWEDKLATLLNPPTEGETDAVT